MVLFVQISMSVPIPMEDVNTTALILVAATIVHVPVLLVILSMRMLTTVPVISNNTVTFSMSCMYKAH